MIEINIIAVIVAAAASFVLGGLWYSPVLFGKAWIKESGFDETQAGHPAKVFGLSFVFSVVAAFAFVMLIDLNLELADISKQALVLGIGIVAMMFGINYQFSNKSAKLLAIDAGYHVAQLQVFALILGLWR